MILESNYIQKDHDLSIQSTPHFINERTVNQLLKKSYHLPIIILYKNKKCLVNPFILNQELYGMCHIIVIPTNREVNYVQINYPNHEKEKIFYEKKVGIFRRFPGSGQGLSGRGQRHLESFFSAPAAALSAAVRRRG